MGRLDSCASVELKFHGLHPNLLITLVAISLGDVGN
jgi:hypothetical protein